MIRYLVTERTWVDAETPEEAIHMVVNRIKGGDQVVTEETVIVDSDFLSDNDLRQCDTCFCITDAGNKPDWVNGECEDCDPTLLDQ